jgi:hypothetical protein
VAIAERAYNRAIYAGHPALLDRAFGFSDTAEAGTLKTVRAEARETD